MNDKPVEEMTIEECYAAKRAVQKQRCYPSPEAKAQLREYKKQMNAKLNARLHQLGASTRIPGDTRRFGPGQTRWQGA